MKLLNFFGKDGSVQLGIATEQGIIDVQAVARNNGLDVPTDIHAAIEAGTDSLTSVVDKADSYLSESDITFAPAITSPEKILCIGLNYGKHAEESGMAVPDTPVVFSKFNNTLASHGDDIPLPSNALEYDYEVELGVVIGKTTRYVSEEDALDYVFGYCTINDISVRDLQMRTSQWLLGKTMDKALPIGPYILSSDEVSNPHDLKLTTHVNGDLRQNSNTSDLIFNINQVISYISQYFTLKPGDVISTGTPEGVGMGMTPKTWLKAGDTSTVEIEGLGALTNTYSSEG